MIPFLLIKFLIVHSECSVRYMHHFLSPALFFSPEIKSSDNLVLVSVMFQYRYIPIDGNV